MPKNKNKRPEWLHVQSMTCNAIDRYAYIEPYLAKIAAPKKIRKKMRKALDLFFEVNQYAIKQQKKR